MRRPEYSTPEGSARLYLGDCREIMAEMDAASVDLIVTSPPYWGLRDYGIEPTIWNAPQEPCGHDWQAGGHCRLCGAWRGVLGLEPRVEMFIDNLLEVFDQVWRVLSPIGTLWVNLGDCYVTDGAKRRTSRWTEGQREHQESNRHDRAYTGSWSHRFAEAPTGSLVGVPWLFALAMQRAGWVLRSDCIWAKRSPMPETVSGWQWSRCRRKIGRRPADYSTIPAAWNCGTNRNSEPPAGNYRNQGGTVAVWEDCPGCPRCEAAGGWVLSRGSYRPTRSHEYVFQFAKEMGYVGDLLGGHEPASVKSRPRVGANGTPKLTPKEINAPERCAAKADAVAHRAGVVTTRNHRSVWFLSSEGSKVQHYATFPTELVGRCFAGCYAPGGYCVACGAPIVRKVSRERIPTRSGIRSKLNRGSANDGSPYMERRTLMVGNRDPFRHCSELQDLGLRPTCACQAAARPAVVFDPFAGTATTGVVALRRGLQFIGCDASGEYLAAAAEILAKSLEQPRKRRRKEQRAPVAQQMQFLFSEPSA